MIFRMIRSDHLSPQISNERLMGQSDLLTGFLAIKYGQQAGAYDQQYTPVLIVYEYTIIGTYLHFASNVCILTMPNNDKYTQQSNNHKMKKCVVMHKIIRLIVINDISRKK